MRVLVAWLPAIALAALIFALSSVPGLAVAEGLWDLVTRKAAHLTVYALLALACLRGLAAHGIRGDRALLGALAATVLYAVSDELHQSTVPRRHGAPLDVVIDAVGASAALLAVRVRARRRRAVSA